MRQITRKGLITMAAAGGAIALGGGYAHAGAGADGVAANSPGVGSGNSVQVPVHVPVNACGNTVNVVGLLNPAFGNNCANVDSGPQPGAPVSPAKPGGGPVTGGPGQPGTGVPGTTLPAGVSQTGSGSHASGGAHNSPGVGSGNSVQAPIDVPVNACGNSVDVVGLLNPTFGNECVNAPEAPPVEPVKPVTPPVKPVTPPAPPKTPPGQNGGPGESETPRHVNHQPKTDEPRVIDQLAQTGSESLGLIIPVGAGMMLAGVVLYRRARASA
ncbi:chaplin family protein [Streptomyces sp. CAU 1734]|uniref:chaplin n=1 Tax=Streptomyces sp. CAU 1734 TaxID=3140360 RepID=UPI003261862D